MRKLEEEPESYDSKFTTLTKGVNLKVQEWILNKIDSNDSILEVGCGTGDLAAKMVSKGNNVIAIDNNPQMIDHAMKNYHSEEDSELLYQIGSFTDYPVEPHSKNLIVSTFMLSELRPLEQQIFLRNSWKVLKPDGRLIIAAEFIPSGFWKQIFKLKRWRYKKKLRRLQLKATHVVKWFFNYLEPIGFKVTTQQAWKHGFIKAIELQKIDDDGTKKPGYYQPKEKCFWGLRSQLRIYRSLLTGQIDRVPIEPGIYPSGDPKRDSPIIVTANYEYTYIKVMRDIKKLDAWILCVDSNGINVWCAARGNDFGNAQLLEAVEATGIQYVTDKRILILPQLSAGGVAVPMLPKKSEKFPFKVKYGPVWSKDLPQYIKDNPARKPDSMKLANFSISHRFRAGITHTTFLFRKIFVYPIITLLLLFMGLNFFTDMSDKFWWLGEFCLSIMITSFFISLMFPLSEFTRCFIKKGLFFGTINILLLGGLAWIFHQSIILLLFNFVFYFWIAFFSTMSFSGYTMSTNPREIQDTYSLFTIINLILLVVSVVLLSIGVFFYQV
jgi:ubiquinone/menaquinone biosynthesis C-methylase UbiE